MIQFDSNLKMKASKQDGHIEVQKFVKIPI